jgi:hypothetical protein
MDHLSSCYFCGSALDDPLQEYPVVPEPFRTDEPTTATLCPTCHQKLDTVLEAVVDAADAERGAATSTPSTTGDDVISTTAVDDATPTDVESMADSGSEPDTTATSEGEDPSGAFGDAAGVAEADTATATEETDGPLAVDDAFADPEPGDREDGDRTEDITADDVASMAGDIDPSFVEEETDDEPESLRDEMEPDIPDEFDSGSDPLTDGTEDETADDGDDTDDAEDSENSTEVEDAMRPNVPSELQGNANPDTVGTADDDPLGGSEAVDAAAEEGGSAETAETDAASPNEPAETETSTAQTDAETGPDEGTPTDAGDESAPRVSISALEYNKVMRLLQNRQFPVEREEIETVAANAYDLSRSECAEVIDLAVDRGLIDESGSQLTRPE